MSIIDSSSISIDTIFDSCDLNCCTSNNSNSTIYSTRCQVTLQSFIGVCLGRLCYSGECNQFVLLKNITYYQKIKNNNTEIMHEIRSSLSWSSFVSSARIKLILWKDYNDLSIHDSILILLLIINISLTLMTLFVVIKSISHARMLAEKRARRYLLY